MRTADVVLLSLIRREEEEKLSDSRRKFRLRRTHSLFWLKMNHSFCLSLFVSAIVAAWYISVSRALSFNHSHFGYSLYFCLWFAGVHFQSEPRVSWPLKVWIFFFLVCNCFIRCECSGLSRLLGYCMQHPLETFVTFIFQVFAFAIIHRKY